MEGIERMRDNDVGGDTYRDLAQTAHDAYDTGTPVGVISNPDSWPAG